MLVFVSEKVSDYEQASISVFTPTELLAAIEEMLH